jgi:hypothetical protein
MGNRFVVTVLGALACGSKSTPDQPEVIHGNPPAPDPVPAAIPAEPAPAEPAPVNSRGGAMLNPTDAEGRTIFRSAEGACYIQLPPPSPEAGTPAVSFRPPVRRPVDCPPAMLTAGWEACAGGTLREGEGDDCLCTVLGNPPPPPRVVACPAKEG